LSSPAAGLVMPTLRSADEGRPAEFAENAKGEIDPDMIAIAEAIIERRSGTFDPASFRDRYQDALRELVDAKTKGLTTRPRAVAVPPAVITLMEALKRSLALDAELEPKKAAASRPTARRLFLTGFKERCCYPYLAVVRRRTQPLQSRWLHRNRSDGGRPDRTGADPSSANKPAGFTGASSDAVQIGLRNASLAESPIDISL
jgi:hypothetical protein